MANDDICQHVVELDELLVVEDQELSLHALTLVDEGQVNVAEAPYGLKLQVVHGSLTAFHSAGIEEGRASVEFTAPLATLNGLLEDVVYTPPVHWHGIDQLQILLASAGGMILEGREANLTVPIRVEAAEDGPKWELQLSEIETLEDNVVLVEGVAVRAPDTGRMLLVSIEVTHGAVSLGVVDGGLDVVHGRQALASSVSFNARREDVNQALAQMVYTPPSNWSGVDLVKFVVKDGTEMDEAMVNIRVLEVNDAPRFEFVEGDVRTLEVVQGSTHALPNITAVDSDDEVLVLEAAATEGSIRTDFSLPLFVLSNHTRSFAIKGLKSTINVALQQMTYTSSDMYHGEDRLRLTVTDPHGAATTLTINVSVSRLHQAPRLVFPAFIDLSSPRVLNQGGVLKLGHAQSSTKRGIQRGASPGIQLWRSDIWEPQRRSNLSWRYTPISDTMVALPEIVVVANDHFVYAAEQDDKHGRELWVTDGESAGATLIKDVQPGPKSSSAAWLHADGSRVFFAAEGLDLGWHLTSDECGGERPAVSPVLNGITFNVAREALWEPSWQYDCPAGFYWMATAEFVAVVEQAKGLSTEAVYAGQCGWAHTQWEGIVRQR